MRTWLTRTSALFAVSVVMLVVAAPAGAQYSDYSPPVMDWLTPHLEAQQWCNISWCRVDDDVSSSPPTPAERARERRRARREARAERRREQRRKARERRQLRSNARKLAFVPVPEVSAQVRANLIANFAPGDTPTAIQLRTELEARPPLQLFKQEFDRNTNWSFRHTADVYAFSLIGMWLAIDDARRTTKAADRAVRTEIRESMADARSVWAARDADQQEMAERIASFTIVLNGQYNYIMGLGDARPPEVPSPEEFREMLIELGQSSDYFGVDLSAVKLTRRGIVPR